jgi:hypothetical protein
MKKVSLSLVSGLLLSTLAPPQSTQVKEPQQFF